MAAPPSRWSAPKLSEQLVRQHALKNTIIVAFSNKNHLDYTFNWINYVRVSDRDPRGSVSASPPRHQLCPVRPHQHCPAPYHQNHRQGVAPKSLISKEAHVEAQRKLCSSRRSGRASIACSGTSRCHTGHIDPCCSAPATACLCRG